VGANPIAYLFNDATNDKIKRPSWEAIGVSQITTVEPHTSFLQSRNVQFRSTPAWIVHTNDSCIPRGSTKVQGKIGTNKACAASN